MRALIAAALSIFLLQAAPAAAQAQQPQLSPQARQNLTQRSNLQPTPEVQAQIAALIRPDRIERWRSLRTGVQIASASLGTTRCLPATRTFTIRGTGFGAARARRDVLLLRRKVIGTLDIVSWSDTQIVARMPATMRDIDRYHLIITPPASRTARQTIGGGAVRNNADPLDGITPLSNLVTADGCVQYTLVSAGTRVAVTGEIDWLTARFPRDNCRNVDLDTLDFVHQTYPGVPAAPGSRNERTVFRVVDRNGEILSWDGPSYDMAAGALLEE